jgi:hypothetical protein
MADLKPIGSEKLQGQEKLNRILEIARYKENIPNSINETSKVEFGKTLADGNQYEIVKEKSGYIIKKRIDESLDYIEPMKNRKYYKSYSQALKRMNLLAGELNRLNENDTNVSLFTLEEDKKFTLKLPNKPDVQPEPTPEMPSDDMAMGDDTDLDLPTGDEEVSMDMETDVEEPSMDSEMGVGNEEEVDFKVIQKLTGKLGQKIRTMNDSVGMTSEDIKYVLNSILSAVDLQQLDDEDKEDVIAKIEEVETDYDSEDVDLEVSGDEEFGMDMDMDMGMEEPVEGEMGEEMYGSFGHLKRKDSKGDTYYDEFERIAKDSDIYGIGDDEMFDTEEFETFKQLYDKYGDKQKWFGKNDGERMFDLYKQKTGKPFKVKTKKLEGEMGEGDLRDKFNGRDGKVIGVYSNIKKQRDEEMTEEDMASSSISSIMDKIFSESKVDKVIEKYFVLNESEQKPSTLKRVKNSLKDNSILNLTETHEQRLAVEYILSETTNLKFLGKTNKHNLVFEHKGEQIKVTTTGEVL